MFQCRILHSELTHRGNQANGRVPDAAIQPLVDQQQPPLLVAVARIYGGEQAGRQRTVV